MVFLALIVFYIDRMSTISSNMSQLADSIDDVHDDVQEVDLKEMERTSNKLESFLDAQLQNSYGNTNSPRSGGQNSVRHTLEKSNIDVTISYVGSPDWHVGIQDHDKIDETETIFEVKFDEEVNTQGVVGLLVQDTDVTQKENELFDGTPTRLQAQSPYLISSSVPCEDFEKASAWVEFILNKIDNKITEIRNLNDGFDREVQKRLQ